MSVGVDRAQDFLRWLRPHLVRMRKVAFEHGAALVDAVRKHFRSSESATGWRAFLTCFSNLWRSGRYGKEVLLISGCLLFFLMKGLVSDEESGEDGNSKDPAVERTLANPSRNNTSQIYEEEPYGLWGYKLARICSRERDGRPIYSRLPALSMVEEAFVVDTSIGTPYVIGDPDSEAMHRNLKKRSRTEFPAASDKKGRLKACREMAEKNAARTAIYNAQRHLQDRLAPITEELAREARNSRAEFESRQKERQILERQHDYEMAKALEMPIRQYDTYKKTPDALHLDRDGRYYGSDGKLYMIDHDGNKWWIQNGVRGVEH